MNRKSHRVQRASLAEIHGFEVAQKSRPGIPRHVPAGAANYVVARQRADRNALNGRDPQSRGKREKIAVQTRENFFAVIHEIHLVDGRDSAANAQKRSYIGMAVSLCEQAFRRVHENNRQVRRRRSGGHVARVLFVARRVGDDELATRRAEVAIRHVNGNSLLAFRAQAVGQQRKVERATRAINLALLNRGHVILVNRLRVMQQAPDERGLAVVHATRSGKAQQVLLQVCFEKRRKAFRAFGRLKGQHQK